MKFVMDNALPPIFAEQLRQAALPFANLRVLEAALQQVASQSSKNPGSGFDTSPLAAENEPAESFVRETSPAQTNVQRLFRKRCEPRIGVPRALGAPSRDGVDFGLECQAFGQGRSRLLEVALEAKRSCEP